MKSRSRSANSGNGRVSPASCRVERALQNEPGDRIDVDGRDLAAERHRLQRDRAATCERIEHPRRAATVDVANPRAKPVEILSVLPLPVQNPPCVSRFRLATVRPPTRSSFTVSTTLPAIRR